MKYKPMEITGEKTKTVEEVAVKPIVNGCLVVVPDKKSSLNKIKDLMETYPELKLCLAAAYDFLEDKQLIDFFNSMKSDGRLDFLMRLKWEPVLPLIADNSGYLSRSYLKGEKRSLVYEWDEDIRDQIVFERELFKSSLGYVPSGFLPYGGMLDSNSVKPMLNSKIANIVVGKQVNGGYTAAKYKELNILCASEKINSIIYSSDYTGGQDVLAGCVLEAMHPRKDLYVLVFDEETFSNSRKTRFFDFLEQMIIKITESDIEFVLPEGYVSGNKHMMPNIGSSDIETGSWLCADFSPWIGEMEEDVAWEMLAKCRLAVEEYKDSGRADIKRLDSAMKEIYAAEAGKNFYFFGDDYNSHKDQEMDQLYRAGLLNVYRLIKESPPEELYHPVSFFRPFNGESKDESVEVLKGDDYLIWEDKEGDDDNITNLDFPDAGLLSEAVGLADILSFGFELDEKDVHFKFTLKRLDNFWNAPLGFSFPLIDLYIDLNNRYGAGSTISLPGRKVCFNEQNAWEYAIVINGWGAGLYRAGPGSVPVKMDSVQCRKNGDGQTIEVIVPRKIVRGNPFNWGYAVLVMGYARLAVKELPEPIEVKNSSNDSADKVSPVIDIIVPEGIWQDDILKINSYSMSASVPMLRAE